MTDYARPLAMLEPQFDFFVGIDSDGCAFDTMEIKHKECFAPMHAAAHVHENQTLDTPCPSTGRKGFPFSLSKKGDMEI